MAKTPRSLNGCVLLMYLNEILNFNEFSQNNKKKMSVVYLQIHNLDFYLFVDR